MIRTRLIRAGATASVVAAGSLAYYFEGEHNEPYVDPVGVLTSCIGHTSDVQLGRYYSGQECAQKFIDDLRSAEATVKRCTPDAPPASQPALTSFVFNVGSGNYCSSTLARKSNAGDHVGACKELYRWVYAGGRVLPGLIKRREAEAEACLSGLL
jgi:lysozyme